jgi:hypothetical protein
MFHDVNKINNTLLDPSFTGIKTELGTINVTQSAFYSRLIFETYRVEKEWIQIPRGYMGKVIRRSKCTVSRCVVFFEKLGIIDVKRNISSDGEHFKTTTYLRVNIEIAKKYFGDHFTGLNSNSVRAYFLKKVKEKMTSMRDAFCAFSTNETFINNDIKKEKISESVKQSLNSVKNAFEQTAKCFKNSLNAFTTNKSPYGENLMNDDTQCQKNENCAVDSLNDQENDIKTDKRGSDPHYFDKMILTCPIEWVQIAKEEGMREKYIEEDFQDFREYWLNCGKTKNARKSNWSRTWRNRIRDVVNNYRTAYKREDVIIDRGNDNFVSAHAKIEKPAYNGYQNNYAKKYEPKAVETRIQLNLANIDFDALLIHKQIIKKMGEAWYISWIQEMNTFIFQEEGAYFIKSKSSFIESKLKENTIFNQLMRELDILYK